MLSTPLICCSMGVATDCSTVCASAPTYVVCTCTSGGAIVGNSETGRARMVIAPTMTVSSEMTTATIGRLMKNLDTLASRVRRLAVDDLDDGTVSHLQQALDDDAFTGFQTRRHDPEIANALADHHLPDRDDVVAADDCDLMTALQLGHGALRNQHRFRNGRDGEADAPVASGTQQVVRVRKDPRDPDGSGCGVDFSIGERNRPRAFVDASIREHQLKRHPPALLVEALLGGKPPMEIDEHLFGHGEVGLDRIDL